MSNVKSVVPMSETTTATKYAIRDRGTNLFYRGDENDCTGKTVTDAKLYDTFNDADYLANVETYQNEAVVKVIVVSTFTVEEEVVS